MHAGRGTLGGGFGAGLLRPQLRPALEEGLLRFLGRFRRRLAVGIEGEVQAGHVGQVRFARLRTIDLDALQRRVVEAAVLHRNALAQRFPRALLDRGPPGTDVAAGVDQLALAGHRVAQFMADQRAVRAVVRGRVARHVQHRRLQHRGGDDQPVLGEVVGQRRFLRQHVPSAVGVAAADPLHLLAVAPGRGDQHVAAEAAAAHRLHGVVQVAAGRADLDLELGQLGIGLGLGRIGHPDGAIDRAAERIAHVGGDGFGTRARFRREVARGVFAAQHGARGGVDGVQHLFPARRRRGLAAQHAAAEFELGIAPGLAQIGRHRIADVEAQVGLPLFRLEPVHQRFELREQGGVRQRHRVVGDSLRLQELAELQSLVGVSQRRGRDRRVVGRRVAQRHDRLRRLGDARFQVEHQLRLGRGLVLRRAGQHQDFLHVVVVAAEQGLRVGIGTRVIGRIHQAQAALAEIADVAVEVAQVDVRAEVEHHRDADLVQRGDRRGDVLRPADAVDAFQQRRDRVGAVAFDLGFCKAAGPEVAEQLLHVALRRLHRGIEQVALLLLRARLEFRQCAGLATGSDRMRHQPVGVGDRVVIGAGGRRGGRFRLALLLRHCVRRGQRGDQAESDGEGQWAQVRHADRSRERKSRECNKASWRVE